ncbi:MAG: hypothetical protein RL571_3425 [Pseudomonadota bacterium]|jgi:hypothetical protein
MFQLIGLIVMLVIPFLVYAYGQKDKLRQATKLQVAAASKAAKQDVLDEQHAAAH